MMLLDTHSHSRVSFDGRDSRRELALSALDAGLDLLCVTDHYDVVNERSELVPAYDWAPARREHAEAIRALPAGAPLRLLYGLELGNAPACFDAAAAALAEEGLDFVIGSMHNASARLGWVDWYYVDYHENKALALRHLEDYFDSLTALIEWGNYDTLGHLAYPLRYMRDRDGLDLRLSDFRERYVEILRRNAERGRAVEVNTNRGRDTLTDYRDLLLDWKALGGEHVTVGADAHWAEDLGKGIREALDLIKACGFEYVTYFEKRKPVCVRVD